MICKFADLLVRCEYKWKLHIKKATPEGVAFFMPSFLNNQPQPLLPLPQDEHPDAGPKSMLELILKPYPRKSTVTGWAFS